MVARTWLAVILSCIVWFGYLKFFAPPPPTQTPATPEATLGTTGTTSQATGAPSAAPGAIATSAPGIPTKAIAVVPSHSVNNGKVNLTFSSVGGRISEAALIDYHQTIKKESAPISPLSPEVSSFSTGAFFSDGELSELSSAEFQTEKKEAGVLFAKSVNGVELTKEFFVPKDSYYIDQTVRLKFPAGKKQNWGYLLLPIGAESPAYDANEPLKAWETVYHVDEKTQRVVTDSMENGESIKQGNTSWVAFGNRYFATALINQAQLNPDVVLAKQTGFTGAYLRYPLQLKADQSELEIKTRVFVGPKDYGVLQQVPHFHELIDFGMFSVFAYPLLRLLQFFYTFVHNYGIAILLLTVLVRLIFYPLSAKGARSMKAMQKLQPQIAALKERYKDDMQRFNQEQMALFKTHGVNPLGGCLPMLVQIPIFIALYSVLANSVELFHAPFFGWIQDLSSKDPYYIFPALMGVAMFIQQKMTPMAGMDPIQQKMMYMMPVIFTFMMVNLPSGLTAYIFLSTLLGILQQWIINREHAAPVLAKTS